MFPLPSELLSLSGEAAALLRDRRLVYANAAARSVLGEDCVGKDIRTLFGSEIAEAQAPSFAATATVGGRSRLLRFSRAEGMQIVFFSDTDREPEVFGEASLLALRSELMNLSLAADRAGSWATSWAASCPPASPRWTGRSSVSSACCRISARRAPSSRRICRPRR